MIYKTWYIIYIQEFAWILVSFDFELSFNKCPFQSAFDCKKMFLGHLLQVKKTWLRWNHIPKLGRTLPQVCSYWLLLVILLVILLVDYLWLIYFWFYLWSYLWFTSGLLVILLVILLVVYLWFTCDPCWILFTCRILLLIYLWVILNNI